MFKVKCLLMDQITANAFNSNEIGCVIISNAGKICLWSLGPSKHVSLKVKCTSA